MSFVSVLRSSTNMMAGTLVMLCWFVFIPVFALMRWLSRSMLSMR